MADTKQRIPLAVGSTVWRQDNDRLTPILVTGATTRSWVLADGAKIPKTTETPEFSVKGWRTTYYLLTRDAAEHKALDRLRWKLADAIQRTRDYDLLRSVATAVGIDFKVDG